MAVYDELRVNVSELYASRRLKLGEQFKLEKHRNTKKRFRSTHRQSLK
ncbi:32514_t:CDS:1, partial [Gigaspora margarita]